MPLNISGSILSPNEVREYEYNSIIRSGLVLHLDARIFNTVSGTTWFDFSGNGNHFTLYNSVAFDGTGFVFDGVNDYMRSTNTINLSSTNVVTVELGFRVPTITTNTMVFEFTPDWNSNAGAFGAYTNSNGGTASSPTTDNDIHTNSAAATADFNVSNITTNSIYHFIYESGVGTNLYYNGSLATRLRNQNVSSFGGFANNYLYIGSRGGTSGFGQYYLYFFRVYNRKLSISEIQHNYNISKYRFGL